MLHSRRAAPLVAIAALAPALAHANAGIGFFTPAAMSLVLALIPVVIVEWVILRWRLSVGTGRAFRLALVANLASTLLGAVIGVALDLLLMAGTGMSGVSGPIGFTVSLVLMFGISWWIERRTVASMSPAIPRPLVGRAVLVANLASYAMLVPAVFMLVPQETSFTDRSRMTEVLNAMSVEKRDVAEHHAKTGTFPPARTLEKPTTNTLRIVRTDDGKVTGFIASRRKELDGKAIVYEPEVRGRDIVAWRCYVPEAPLKYFPAACRSANAADAMPF